MRQKSNSILDSLKKLYVKITGKKVVKRKTETDVLSDIAEEYVPVEDVVKEYMSKVYEYKGSVSTYSALPTEDLDVGDTYNVIDTGKNYAWTGTEWDNLGGTAIIFTTNIAQLTTSQLNELKAGDVVIKQTGTQNHTYIVTYQEYLHGICLTYIDADTIETVSYDYVDGHWVYNSTDVTKLENMPHLWLVSIGISDMMVTFLSPKGFNYRNDNFYTNGVLDINITNEDKAKIIECLMNIYVTHYDERAYGMITNDYLEKVCNNYTNIYSGDTFNFNVYYDQNKYDVNLIEDGELNPNLPSTSYDVHLEIQPLF